MLLDLNSYPVKPVLPILLQDKTTKSNIIFATDTYEELGDQFSVTAQITETVLTNERFCLLPRVEKERTDQAERTRNKAEVFTPGFIIQKMCAFYDEEWFGRPNVFECPDGQGWITENLPIAFPKEKTWQDYIYSTRIEITCGEAPFLVSRYDTTTGVTIPIKSRIGILDRKLRIVNENTQTEEDWLTWVERAFQSVYGYEYQGDSLLIARINLLITFAEYFEERFGRKAGNTELRKIANIISWNLWQMDGTTGMVPFLEREAAVNQISMFDLLGGEVDKEMETIPCMIHDWRSKETVEYNSLKGSKS